VFIFFTSTVTGRWLTLRATCLYHTADHLPLPAHFWPFSAGATLFFAPFRCGTDAVATATLLHTFLQTLHCACFRHPHTTDGRYAALTTPSQFTWVLRHCALGHDDITAVDADSFLGTTLHIPHAQPHICALAWDFTRLLLALPTTRFPVYYLHHTAHCYTRAPPPTNLPPLPATFPHRFTPYSGFGVRHNAGLLTLHFCLTFTIAVDLLPGTLPTCWRWRHYCRLTT